VTSTQGNGGDEGQSPLDRALGVAELGDAQAQAFYDAFLNARLYVPTAEDDPDLPTDTVSLLVADIEGEGIVPVFDSEDRLATWAEEPVAFTVLAGHALVEQLDPALQIALNVGTEHFKLFVESELAWLRERLGETVTDLAAHDTADLIAFRDGAPPEGLVEALLRALRQNELAGAAFLVEAEEAGVEGGRRYLLVLDVGDADEAAFAEAARDVGVAARSALGGGAFMDIIAFNPLEGTGRALIERAVAPIFVRAQAAPH
jgi:hypothetical protein